MDLMLIHNFALYVNALKEEAVISILQMGIVMMLTTV